MFTSRALFICLLSIASAIFNIQDTTGGAGRIERPETMEINAPDNQQEARIYQPSEYSLLPGSKDDSMSNAFFQDSISDFRRDSEIDKTLIEKKRVQEAFLKTQADMQRQRVFMIIILILMFLFGVLILIEIKARSDTSKALRSINAQLTSQKAKLSETLEDLMISEERYKSLVENSPTGILLLNRNGNILEVNKKMLEILGSPGPEETQKINCLEYAPLKSIGLADDLLESLQAGEPKNRRIEYQSKWGRRVFLNYTISPLKEKNNEVNNLIVNVEDITESVLGERLRMESELKYRILVENSLQAMMIVQGGRVIFTNSRIEELTHYTKDEIMNEGRRWLNLIIHPDDKRRAFRNVKDSLNGQAVGNKQVYRIIRKEGDVRVMETLGSVVEYQSHPAMLIVAIDITERTLAEENLVGSEKRLRDLNAMKDKFFSIIAHDLKNPFSSILGFSNLLHEAYDNLSEKQRKSFIKNICESSENTYKLLQNLLEWSRAQTGKIGHFPEVLDIEALIMDNVSIFKSGFARKNIELMLDVPKGVSAYADENMIKLVLRNLISNALKFTHPGGKVVLSVESNGLESTVSVIDNGIGIEKANLKRLFRIDDQLKTKGTANESGSGLGLILCKEFIEQNKGRIWVKSNPGEGSSFSFSLPANSPEK